MGVVMPTYTMPDGNNYEFASDSEATKAMAAWNAQFGTKQPSLGERALASFPRFGRSIQEAAGTVIEPALTMGTGMLGKVAGDIAGLGAIPLHALGANIPEPTEVQKRISGAMTYQPRTAGGQFIAQNILAPVGGAIEAGAEKIVGATGLEGPLASGAKEALLQGTGFLGVKGAPAIGSSLKAANEAKLLALKEQAANDAIRNRIRQEGKKIGLIAPAEGGVKETLSKIGGVEPHLSLKNREIATNAIASDVGLKKGAITDTDIANRVSALSKNYTNIEKALPPTVAINTEFLNSVNQLLTPMKAKFAQDPRAFSGYSEAISLLEQQLKQKDIDPAILMDKIQQLRSDARTFDKNPSGDPVKRDLADTSYKLANVYEDLIENSLSGKKTLLDKFRESRKQLAQLHILDAARLDDGLLDLQKLGSIVGKYGADKKMVTGNIDTVAKFANTFKNVTKPVTSKAQFQTPSRWETLMALGSIPAAAATGNVLPLLGATPMVARATMPTLAERGMLQGAVPNYNLSGVRRVSPYAAQAGMLGTAFSPYVEEQQ